MEWKATVIRGGESTYAAIYAGLLLGFLHIPVFGSLLCFFVAIPLTVGLIDKNIDKKKFVQYVVIASCLLLLISGITLPVTLSIVYFCILAYLTSLCITHNVSQEISFLTITTSITIMTLVIMYLAFSSKNLPLSQMWAGYLDRTSQNIFKAYKDAGISSENLAVLENSITKVVYFLKSAGASMIFCLFSVLYLVNFYASLHLVLKRTKDKWFSGAKIKLWKLPDVLIWVFILAGLIYVLPFNNMISDIGLNLLVCSCILYLIQGIGILTVFLEKWTTLPFIKLLVLFFVLIQPLLVLTVIGLGIFDVWIDFRKIKQGGST